MKRQNFSRKREAILQTICTTDTHPTAEWVYQTLKPEYPDLSLGTVYRNIAQFKQNGLIVSVGVVNGQERLDGNVEPHIHFICTQCGSVLDLKGEYLPDDLDDTVAESHQLQVDSHELVFRGKCSKCIDSH